MTNLKHTDTCQYHISLSTLTCLILDPVTSFGDFGEYYGVFLRVTNLFGDGKFGMWFLCRTNENRYFVLNSVVWNKFQIWLCDCFNIGKMVFILRAVRFCLSICLLSLFCIEDWFFKLLRLIISDIPEYTISNHRNPRYKYSLQSELSFLNDNINVPSDIACCTLLCGTGEYWLLECIHAIIQGAHTLYTVCTDHTVTSCQL